MEMIEHNTPLRLADQIDYAPGQVVKRDVMAAANGEAFVFAVEKEAGIKEHSFNGTAIVHVLEGELVFTLDGADHDMKAGDSIVVEAGRKHSLSPVTPFKVAVVRIHA